MKNFVCKNISQEDMKDIPFFVTKKGKGLEVYLKKYALNEESKGSRTYIVRDEETGEIAGYFTLRSGLITIKRFLWTFDTLTGIELTNFAVNDAYKEHHSIELKGIRLGEYIFKKFVIPLVKQANKIIGAEYLYIFALPEDALIAYYKDVLKFCRLDKKMERFIHSKIRPRYDAGCIFMLQRI